MTWLEFVNLRDWLDQRDVIKRAIANANSQKQIDRLEEELKDCDDIARYSLVTD
jgi:hypothetical protein